MLHKDGGVSVIAERHDAYQATSLLAIMVRSLRIVIAVFRLGDLTRYISESVVLGFMAGAGLLVGLGQVANLLRRARNPDLVCMEQLEQFLREMDERDVPVWLCGVRADLARVMENLRFQNWLARERVVAGIPAIPGLATVTAVQRAYDHLDEAAPGSRLCHHCVERRTPRVERLEYLI